MQITHLRIVVVLSVMFTTTKLPAQDTTPSPNAKALVKLLEKERQAHGLPALGVGLVRDGKPALVRVVGVRKIDTQAKAGDDDLWHLGSDSKPITALLLAILMDLGLIDWDTRLADVFPDLSDEWSVDAKTITMRHLLTHTSGLPRNWPGGWVQLSGKESPEVYRRMMMQQVPKAKLDHKPGTKYQYSNLGYTVLGAVIDKVTKSTWEAEVQKRVFTPLGIRCAGFGPTSLKDDLRQPWPHFPSGKAVPAKGVLDNPSVMNPAGRIHMSIADINCVLCEMLRIARGEKGLLKTETARKIFTNPVGIGPHSLSGWSGIRPKSGNWSLQHDGSNVLNYCTIQIFPERNLAVVVCTNKGGPEARQACHAVRKILAK